MNDTKNAKIRLYSLYYTFIKFATYIDKILREVNFIFLLF